jgi:hypothetical protein
MGFPSLVGEGDADVRASTDRRPDVSCVRGRLCQMQADRKQNETPNCPHCRQDQLPQYLATTLGVGKEVMHVLPSERPIGVSAAGAKATVLDTRRTGRGHCHLKIMSEIGGCRDMPVRPSPPPLDPGHLDRIGLETIVMPHDRQALDLRLRDQHAVEWIAVVGRQRRQPLGMLEYDRERLKAADLHAERKRDLETELAEADLDRRLPRRRQADIDRFSGADFVAGALI